MEDLATINTFVFDMDGTLVDSDLNFDRIREEARVPDDTPILEYIDSAVGHRKTLAREVLLKHEAQAAENCRLIPDAQKVLSTLRHQGHNLAILTRNSRKSAELVLDRFGFDIDCVVSRDDAQPKPSPEPIRQISSHFGASPSQMMVIGDYLFDLEAAHAAGAQSALLRTNRTETYIHRADLQLDRLSDLLDYAVIDNQD